jgi:hypothetical protein
VLLLVLLHTDASTANNSLQDIPAAAAVPAASPIAPYPLF